MRNLNPSWGASPSPAAARSRKRRPAGISRRQKQRLTFETLEDRRVMSADTGVAAQSAAVAQDLQLQLTSLSSDTPEGYLAILQNELFWQSLSSEGGKVNNYGTLAIPTDPLLSRQWHLINSGQEVGNPDFQPIFGVPGEDINVAGAWNMGYTGQGVVVAVVDSGVQTIHPDLAANIHPVLGLDALDGNGNGNPNVSDPGNAHGTAVAGIIGAVANNGIGGAGIASGAQIVPIRLIDPDGLADLDAVRAQQAFIDTFRYAINEIDITNNSWGSTFVRGLAPMSRLELEALRDSIFFGRNGLGVIHVFSSGNSAGPNFDNSGPDPTIDFLDIGGYDSAAYDAWNSSRYTISVTGVDHDGFYNNVDGTVTAYPEAGPGVLVAAPTGSNASLAITDTVGLGSGITTTDLTGEFGVNVAPNPITGAETEDPFFPFDRDFLLDTDYTTRFNGTSAAAPMVSGVIALMLEANPNLSWRDVQEILIRSARQNAPYETPLNGQGQGLAGDAATSVLTSTNLWKINQMPLFHAPDIYDPGIPPEILTAAPTSDPNLFTQSVGDHFAPIVDSYTNGAGYTISQGTGYYGEQIGYGHGVVDATLAVQMAAQWHTSGQALPSERTFTSFVTQPEGPDLNIPAAEVAGDGWQVIPGGGGLLQVVNGGQLIPGKLGGAGGFGAFWGEYFADDPDFNQTFPAQGTDLKFRVPASQTMSVETVEVKVSISGDQAAALDHLRVVLVSPDGTQSELNNFWVPPVTDALQNETASTVRGEPGSVATSEGNLVYTFTTNRSWGERTDNQIVFDPTTGLPVVDQTGTLNAAWGGEGLGGEAFERGWTLVFENYDTGNSFGLGAAEVAWHGSPIGANTKRIQGVVGIDANQDDQFSFDRVVDPLIVELDSDPGVRRYGEVISGVDASPLETKDAFASNITVVARRASDGAVVDRFVTGADGNFYFDLVPDDYIISIEDPEGRVAKDDSSPGAGTLFLQDYQTEWEITADFFKVWQRDANLEVPVDGNGTPLPWLDDNGSETEYHVKGVNFLLDPGAPVAPEADFSGIVFADTNGDGVFNGDDVLMPNTGVFADTNRNGVRDAGETLVTTDATGAYTLTVPLTSASIVSVAVDLPANWQTTSPEGGLDTRFAVPGDSFTAIDFAIAPPPNSAPGVGIAQNGIVLGVVFNDANTNGSRQTGEAGVPGITVYIDSNNSGVLDAGDIQTVTNQHGAFVFTAVPPQTNLVIRAVVSAPFSQTVPFLNGANVINLASGDTVSGVLFGLKNSAVEDYGDLPAIYGATTFAENGARHKKGLYWLGAAVDADINGQPNATATGDDINGIDDEDGVTISPLVAGTNTATIVTSRHGGWLTGWIDFNDDGDFNDAGERLEFTHFGTSGVQVGTKVLLDAGTNTVQFEMPAGVTATDVYARFRYGDFSVNSIFGPSPIGEVEDYLLPVAAVGPLVFEAPDATGDGRVTGADFMSWQRNVGKTSGASSTDGDANGDGAVNGADLSVIMGHYGDGMNTTANLVSATGDFNVDGSVTGADFLAWQRGVGKETGVNLYMGDGDNDGQVGAGDLAAWSAQFGLGPGVSQLGATSGGSSAQSSSSLLSSTLATESTLVDAAAATLSNDAAIDVARFATLRDQRAEAFEHFARREESHNSLRSERPIAPLADLRRDDAFDDFATRRRNARHDRLDAVGDDVLDAAVADALADEAYWRFS